MSSKLSDWEVELARWLKPFFRSPEDPNDVVILQDVADVSKARTWLTSVSWAAPEDGSPSPTLGQRDHMTSAPAYAAPIRI